MIVTMSKDGSKEKKRGIFFFLREIGNFVIVNIPSEVAGFYNPINAAGIGGAILSGAVTGLIIIGSMSSLLFLSSLCISIASAISCYPVFNSFKKRWKVYFGKTFVAIGSTVLGIYFPLGLFPLTMAGIALLYYEVVCKDSGKERIRDEMKADK